MNYLQLKKLGKDVELFADFTDAHAWSKDFPSLQLRPLTRPTSPAEALTLAKRMDQYDRVLIHHHIEPILAHQLARALPHKVAWYSGSPFEPAYSHLLYGKDYRKVSLTLDATTRSFYGRYLASLGLKCYPLSKTILRVLDLETVRRYHKILANSEYQANYVKNIYHRDAVIVYPPLEDSIFAAKEEKQLPSKLPFALMVGAFVYYKNFEAGIKAMLPIKEQCSLVLVGSGLLQKQYERLAASAGVSLQVCYGSSDRQMHSLYSQASFVIHPSMFEGFGFVAAEAALHGKPSVLTTHSGVRELLRDGESTYLCPPSDLLLMSQRVRQLATSPEEAIRMGSNAHASIQPLCGSEQSRKLWEALEAW